MTPDDIGDDNRRQGNDIIASKTKLHKSFLVASGNFEGVSRRAVLVFFLRKTEQKTLAHSFLAKPDA